MIPASDSSDDSSDENSKRKKKPQDDFVEIVNVVKPRNLRTPEIIDLSSEEVEVGSDKDTKSKKNKKAAKKSSIEAIEISSGSDVQQTNIANSANNSDNGNKNREKTQLEDEIAARAEFKRILENERYTKRRILSYLQARTS